MRRIGLCLVFLLWTFAVAQTSPAQDSMEMPGMEHMHHNMGPVSFIESLQHHAVSGTDVEPRSTPAEMWMITKGNWNFMLHGEAFLTDVQQSGPRGADKFFSTDWFMGMAQRKLARGTFTVRTMLSLDPATVSARRYPELFQQGETAFGRPIVDGQHPHDFFMELAAMYDYKLSDRALLSIYAAPMGDPAMGPIAYPHRESASENPLASLGHHLQDSTHVAADVVTAGLTYRNVRVEASGFRGREPDESRWNIETGRMDSWSARVTASPGKNWIVQYSLAGLTSPEALAPGEDVRRMTASVAYNRPLAKGNWASTLIWGRNSSLTDHNIGNSYLLESTLRFVQKNLVWTRVENVDRTTELLLGNNPEPPGFEERYFARVQAYTAGLGREFGNTRHLSTSVGAQVSWYGVPGILRPMYGSHPVGVAVFLRLRLR